ncbi:hypothetical protein V2J09_001016 [Rumex salicifolius]
MAISPIQRLFLLLSVILFSVLFPETNSASSSIAQVDEGGEDVHEILPKYNLPKGLFPDAPNTYDLSSDGSFSVRLQRTCYVHFDDQLVYYDSHITGHLRPGSVSSVTGIQAKKFFLWVPVTGMDLDPDTNSIVFHVGALSDSLPADRFQDVPRCMSKIGDHLDYIPLSSS